MIEQIEIKGFILKIISTESIIYLISNIIDDEARNKNIMSQPVLDTLHDTIYHTLRIPNLNILKIMSLMMKMMKMMMLILLKFV